MGVGGKRLHCSWEEGSCSDGVFQGIEEKGGVVLPDFWVRGEFLDHFFEEGGCFLGGMLGDVKG